MQHSSDSRSRTRQHPRRRAGPRTHRACVSCKDKKLKCDDQAPSCANCSRLSLTCLFEDPETKARQPRNYIKTLEARVALLQETSQSPPVGVTASSSTPASEDQHQATSRQGATTLAESEPDLSLHARHLDVRSSQAEPHYLGSSSTFAFSNIVNASLRRHLPGRARPLPGLLTRPLSSPTLCFLPDEELALRLSTAYFENIQPQYPFLHEPTFRIWERKLYIPQEGGDLALESIPSFFVHMIYAAGALLLPEYQSLAEQLYASAQLYSDVLSLDSLEAIQALLCYAMYSLRSPIGPSLWKVSGLAVRQCIELGYHRRRKPFGPVDDPHHVQMRRRVFWCAYGIDCMVSQWLGLPLALPLCEISVELPMDVDDISIVDNSLGTPRSQNDSPTSMSNAIHVFRLRILWARIHHSLYSEEARANTNDAAYLTRMHDFRAELEQWLASAPEVKPRTGHTLSIFATTAWYKLNYNYTILYLYRTQLAEERSAADSVFPDCFQASKEICTQYRRLYVGTPVRHTWGTLRCIFFSGLVYLHCLWTAPGTCGGADQQDVNRTCTDALMVMVVIAQAWDEAAPYRDLFEVLANRTMAMISEKATRLYAPSLSSPVTVGDKEPETLMQWMADGSNSGMTDAMEELLAGFMDDFISYDANT